ncbi:MAG: DUF4012 domain-containing protein [Actinomycetota bacterium]|nr:DUF4012 domain-containing protein [Actinomycetota bacterium]
MRVRTRVRKRHRRSSRRRLQVLLGVLGGLLLILAITAFAAIGIRAQLVEARQAMAAGRTALLAGDASGAREAFDRAVSAFLRARSQYRNPLLLGMGYLPLIGRNPDAVGSVIEAGTHAADAGRSIAGAAEDLPEGAAALGPENGEIPLGPLQTMAPALERALGLLERADAAVAAAPEGFLLPPVDEARTSLVGEVARAGDAVRVGAALSRALPPFLGADGERRYFVGAQNPAELRGTGGFIGAFAILTADEGRLELSGFRTITDLPSVDPSRVTPPSEDYAARYDGFGGAGFWQNINMTPDFPSAATAIERLYEEVTGDPLDGVIVADPFALASMLAVTGAADVPGTDLSVDADSVVPFVTNEAYAEFTDPNARKRLLGVVAGEVLRRFLEGGIDPSAAGRALVEAGAGSHLLLHSVDPEIQRSLVEAGVAGALPTRGDLLAVIGNNAAGNKVDYYTEQRIDFAVRLGAGGSATAATSVTITNEAPSEGPPAYVIGPYDERFEAGQNLTYLSTYCPRACTLDEFDRSGGPDEVGAETELGLPVFPTLVSLPSGGAEQLDYEWTYQDAWTGDGSRGRYGLTVRTQPTIRPTQLHVEVEVPEGMHIVEASPEMRVSGGRAVWEGEAETEARFELAFERPPIARIWQEFLDWLGRPVLRLGDGREGD